MPAAVIFDLDGVLLDSEHLWNEAKKQLVLSSGGRWREEAPTRMMGMSSPEWSAYLHDELGVRMEPAEINREVVRRIGSSYEETLPLLPGAREAVLAIAKRWPVGLASSSNREILDRFLTLAELSDAFGAVLSSEEVARGKPAPDVYLAAAAALGVEAPQCVAIEDSSNGIRAAAAAEMTVIAVPNTRYPPAADALRLAAAIVENVGEVDPILIERIGTDGS